MNDRTRTWVVTAGVLGSLTACGGDSRATEAPTDQAAPVEEFELRRIELDETTSYHGEPDHGAEILPPHSVTKTHSDLLYSLITYTGTPSARYAHPSTFCACSG